jgi:RNA polymerase sigma-70 factor (ECF subfamily)
MNAKGTQRLASSAAMTGTPHPAEAVLLEGRHTASTGERVLDRGPDGGELVCRARRGDRAALDQLLAAARPRALAVALKMLRNPDDAEDAVQDAFLKIWRSLARFEGRSSFSTWVHRIVMNACLDLRRRQSARPDLTHEAESAGGGDAEVAALEPSAPETPERALGRAQVGQLVHGILDELSPVHRQALVLRELEEHSYEEIATIAACPVGTVMSRLHHARKKLAEELTTRLPQDGPTLCAA